jgi:cytoskeleton protein RodZ
MKELAEYLKSERLKQGVPLPQMSERARVSISMLQALEEGNYERIGTSLLIRSFTRAYCGSLGIDAEPLLEKYASEIRAADQQNEGIRRFGRWSKALRKRSRIGIFAVLLLGIALLGLIYGGAWFWKSKEYSGATQSLRTSGYPQQDLPSDLSNKAGQGPGSETKKTAPALGGTGTPSFSEDRSRKSEKTPIATATPKGQEGPAPKPPAVGASPAEVLPEPTDKPVPVTQNVGKRQLSVEATQKTWIQVTMDDKTTQSAMLEPGDSRQWEAEKTMRIIVGNAGGIHMKWDGRPLEVPGKSGSVIRLSLPDQRYLKE